MSKITVYDQIVIEKPKTEQKRWQSKKCLHEIISKRLCRSELYSLLRRINAVMVR